MDVIKTFGNYVEKWCEGHPERARWLLKTGWEAENLKFTVAPSKRMNPIRSISCKVNDECHAAAIKTSGKFCFGKCIHSM